MGDSCRGLLLLVSIFLFISSCDVEDEEETVVNPCEGNKCVFYEVDKIHYRCFDEKYHKCLYYDTSVYPDTTVLELCSFRCEGRKWEFYECCDYFRPCNEKTGKCRTD